MEKFDDIPFFLNLKFSFEFINLNFKNIKREIEDFRKNKFIANFSLVRVLTSMDQFLIFHNFLIFFLV